MMSTSTVAGVHSSTKTLEVDESNDPKVRVYRSILWLAALLPFIYSNARSAADVQEASFGFLDAVRGAGSVLLLGAAILIARPSRLRLSSLDVAFACFASFAALSALWSVDPRSSFVKVVPLVSMYLAIRLVIASYNNASRALNSLLTLVHVLLLATAFQVIVLPSLALTRTSDSDVLRLGTVLPQIGANPLAYLATVGILAVILGLGPAAIVEKQVLRYSTGMLYLLELLATRTRSGLLVASIIVVLLLTFLALKRPAIFITGLLLISATVLTAITYTSSLTDFLRRGQSDQSIETLTGRTEIWEVAIASISENPLAGLGFYAGHRVGLVDLQNYGSQSNLDNTWLELLVDVGFVGTSFMLIFLMIGLFFGFNRAWDWRQQSLILTTLAYGSVISLVNPTLQMPGVAFLLMVGVFLAANEKVLLDKLESNVRSGIGGGS